MQRHTEMSTKKHKNLEIGIKDSLKTTFPNNNKSLEQSTSTTDYLLLGMLSTLSHASGHLLS